MDAIAQSLPLIGIYDAMIAGAFPLAEGLDPLQTVRMQAQEVLHANNVHVYLRNHDGYVFYLACDSRSLASTPGFATPLVAALPGGSSYAGDGCYVLSLPNSMMAALVINGLSIKLLVNTADVVLETCGDEGLERYDVTSAPAEQLLSQAWVNRHLSNKVATAASQASLGMIALSVLILLASNVVSGYMGKRNGHDAAATADKANSIIESTSTVQPLADTLNRVQTLSYAVVAAGGWIEGYNYHAKAGDKFVVTLPSWVTQDAIKTLGEGVRTEAQPEPGFIWASKKDATGAAVKNRGPAPIAVVPPPPSLTGAVKTGSPAASAADSKEAA